jgi:hypothetical protein
VLQERRDCGAQQAAATAGHDRQHRQGAQQNLATGGRRGAGRTGSGEGCHSRTESGYVRQE